MPYNTITIANNKRYEDGKKGGRPNNKKTSGYEKEKTTGFENKKPNNNVNDNNNENNNDNAENTVINEQVNTIQVEKKSFTIVEIPHSEAEIVSETVVANDENVHKPKRVYRRKTTAKTSE